MTYEPKSLLSNNSLFFYTYGDPINAVQSLNVGFPALIKYFIFLLLEDVILTKKLH